MLARLSAFVIWALVAATAVFWGLRLFVRPVGAPAYAVTVGEAGAVGSDLGRLLGVTAANGPAAVTAPAASSRFRLLGIVAPTYVPVVDPSEGGHPSHGVALIAVDGKMAKAFAVGAHVDGDLVLQSVSLRTVSIAQGQGSPAITLELPPPSSPATGTLPGAVVGGLPAPTVPALPQAAPQFIPQPIIPQPQYAQPAAMGQGLRPDAVTPNQ